MLVPLRSDCVFCSKLPCAPARTRSEAASKKRPVSAVADAHEVRNVAEVEITVAPERQVTLLFDPGHNLDERILVEYHGISNLRDERFKNYSVSIEFPIDERVRFRFASQTATLVCSKSVGA